MLELPEPEVIAEKFTGLELEDVKKIYSTMEDFLGTTMYDYDRYAIHFDYGGRKTEFVEMLKPGSFMDEYYVGEVIVGTQERHGRGFSVHPNGLITQGYYYEGEPRGHFRQTYSRGTIIVRQTPLDIMWFRGYHYEKWLYGRSAGYQNDNAELNGDGTKLGEDESLAGNFNNEEFVG